MLASNDSRAVLGVRRLSQASYRKMWQNLVWAAGYNLAAVPLAAGVLAGIGVVLPMEVGAILMSLSTVIVALNAQLLRRLDLRPAEGPGWFGAAGHLNPQDLTHVPLTVARAVCREPFLA